MDAITIITNQMRRWASETLALFVFMKLKVYFIVFMIAAISIVQNASAHKVGLSYTEIVMHSEECVITMTFDEEDILDPHFLATLEQYIQRKETHPKQELNSVAARVIALPDDALVVSMGVQRKNNNVTLIMRFHAKSMDTLHFPILRRFGRGHRQLVAVLRDTTLIAQYLVHAGNSSIVLNDQT